MAFSKYDPHRPEVKTTDARSESAARRAWILKVVTWVTFVYTAVGFGFLALFWLGLFP